MERKFPGKSFRKLGCTAEGQLLFRKLCKIAILYSVLVFQARSQRAGRVFEMDCRYFSLASCHYSCLSINTCQLRLNAPRKRFSEKKNAPMVYLFVFRCCFCIGWLRNLRRLVTRAEPLCHTLTLLFCDVFTDFEVCSECPCCYGLKVTILTFLRSLSKTRRRRQRERHKTNKNTIAVR